MKKIVTLLLSALLLVYSLAACGNQRPEINNSNPVSLGAATDTVESTESSGGNNAHAEDGVQTSGSDTENTGLSETQQPEAETPETQGSKVLVAYFSATGTTEGVAEHIANGLNADIYEIIPEEPYTDADLNYNDNNSRSTIEMNDPSSRPAISGSVENMEQYDIVFIGYAGGIIGLNQEKPTKQGFALV